MSTTVSNPSGASAASQPSPAPPARAPTSAAPPTAGAPGVRRHSAAGGIPSGFPPTPMTAAAAAALAEVAAREYLASAQPPRTAARPERELELEVRLLEARNQAMLLELELERTKAATSGLSIPPAPFATPAAAHAGGSGNGLRGPRQSLRLSETDVELNLSPGTPGHSGVRPGDAWAGAYASPLMPSAARAGAPLPQLIVHKTMVLKQPPAAPKLDDDKFRKDIDKVKEPIRLWLNLVAAWDRSNAGAREALGPLLRDIFARMAEDCPSRE